MANKEHTKQVWTPRQINSLLYFVKHGLRLSDLRGAHQGTIGSLVAAKALNRHGVTAVGLRAIERYNTRELSSRLHEGELSERVTNLLSLVRGKSRGASA